MQNFMDYCDDFDTFEESPSGINYIFDSYMSEEKEKECLDLNPVSSGILTVDETGTKLQSPDLILSENRIENCNNYEAEQFKNMEIYNDHCKIINEQYIPFEQYENKNICSPKLGEKDEEKYSKPKPHSPVMNINLWIDNNEHTLDHNKKEPMLINTQNRFSKNSEISPIQPNKVFQTESDLNDFLNNTFKPHRKLSKKELILLYEEVRKKFHIPPITRKSKRSRKCLIKQFSQLSVESLTFLHMNSNILKDLFPKRKK